MKKRLNNLTELTSLLATDLVYIERVVGLAATGYKAQASNLPGGFGYFVAINGDPINAPYSAAMDETSTQGSLGTWNVSNQWVAPATGLYLAHFRSGIEGSAAGLVSIRADSTTIATADLASLQADQDIIISSVYPLTAGQTFQILMDLATGSIGVNNGSRFSVARLA
jgi:hypothetical protein